jgi:hypothetical protein
MFSNGLLVMDALADAGFTVLGIGYLGGVSTSLMITLGQFCLQITIRTSSSIAKAAQNPVRKHRKGRNDHSDPNFDYEASHCVCGSSGTQMGRHHQAT